jgi:hypothetical protein
MRYDRDDAWGFLEGNPGVWAIAHVIYDSLGNTYFADQFLETIKSVFKRVLTE